MLGYDRVHLLGDGDGTEGYVAGVVEVLGLVGESEWVATGKQVNDAKHDLILAGRKLGDVQRFLEHCRFVGRQNVLDGQLGGDLRIGNLSVAIDPGNLGGPIGVEGRDALVLDFQGNGHFFGLGVYAESHARDGQIVAHASHFLFSPFTSLVAGLFAEHAGIH